MFRLVQRLRIVCEHLARALSVKRFFMAWNRKDFGQWPCFEAYFLYSTMSLRITLLTYLCTKSSIMYPRKIFPELEKHLLEKEITVITGMRRVGKSTALRHLMGQVWHENKVFLDLERPDHRLIFEHPLFGESQRELEQMGLDFSKPAAIFLDEVQLVPTITSFMKYYHDHFAVKFVVTGSSSFYLRNRFSESLAGRKRIFEMYPLDFQEFLQFRNVESATLEKWVMQP
ncbi:MAG: AAA family ATPase, partial [Saprospiraceae bacterium]